MTMTMMTPTTVDGFQLQQHRHRQHRQQQRHYATTNNVGDGDDSVDDGVFAAATTTTRRSVLQRSASVLLGTSTLAVLSNLRTPFFFGGVEPASARLEAVDRPDLLPKEYTNIIQTEKYLTSGQAKRLDTLLSNLEKDTGFRVRVLCQQYPNTPGLAIRDYWSLGKDDQKDDKYVVLVVDNFNGRGNALNFNVGDGVKFALPNVFWTRLSGKYGTTFFIKENGMDVAIENAIEAIVSCLRNEDGYCTAPPEQGQSMKSLGLR